MWESRYCQTVSLHQCSNDNGVTVVNCRIREYSSYIETFRNTLGPLLTGRLTITLMALRYSYVRYFRAADYDTDHYLVTAKVRDRLSVSKQTGQNYTNSFTNEFTVVIYTITFKN
jgi:hypothetical protein